MEIQPQMLVADVAVGLPASMILFDRWGIDYCCHGNHDLAKAAKNSGNDLAKVLSELRHLQTQSTAPDWLQKSTSDLLIHIEKVHNDYARIALDGLRPAMTKVLLSHIHRHSFLADLSEACEGLFDNIERHIAQEETVAFPLFENVNSAMPQEAGSLIVLLEEIEGDHAELGDALRLIREITQGFLIPAGACTTFRALYAGLAELDKDIKAHIHLENNILHPRIRRACGGQD